MRKLFSKLVALMFIASIAIPQTFAATIAPISVMSVMVTTSFTMDLSVTDLDGDTVSVTADFDWGDGTVPTTDTLCVFGAESTSCSTTYTYNTTGSYTADIDVNEFDASGTLLYTTSTTAIINVTPLSPLTLMVMPPVGTFYVGTSVSLDVQTMGGGSDLEYMTVDWGDLSTPETSDPDAGETSFSFDYSYSAADTYNVIVTAYDGFTTATSIPVTVIVMESSVPSTPLAVELTPETQDVDSGVAATVTATVTGGDGSLDTVSFTWGDSTIDTYSVAAATLESSATTITGTHTYTYELSGTTMPYSVSVAVSDGTSAAPATDTVTVNVSATSTTPLSVEAGDDQEVSVDAIVTVSPTSTGGDGTLDSATIDWGDGLSDTEFSVLPVGDLAVTSTYTYTTAGIYTVTVTATDGTNPSASDTLTVYVEESCTDDVCEENDSPDEAYSITSSYYSMTDGMICEDDADYYEVALAVGDTLTVDLDYTYANGDLVLYVSSWDLTDSSYYVMSDTLDDDETITYTATASDDYYVVVTGGGGAENSYDLTINVTEASTASSDTTSTLVVEAGIDQTMVLGTLTTVSAIATDLSADGVGANASIDWGDDTIASDVTGVLDAAGIMFTATHTYTASGVYIVTVEADEVDSSGAVLNTASDTLTVTIAEPETTNGGGTTGEESGGTDDDDTTDDTSDDTADDTTSDDTTDDTSDDTTDDDSAGTDDDDTTSDDTTDDTSDDTADDTTSDDTTDDTTSDDTTDDDSAGTTDTDSDSSSSSSSSSGSSGGATYGGGAGNIGGSSSSSSSSDDDQEVTIAEEETTVDVCGELPFTDVSPDDSYYDAIYQSWCENIVHGRTTTTFTPIASILRGEVAKIVAGVFGYSPVADLTETSYSDLDPNENLAPYIQALTNAGILEGYKGDGTFRFDQAITVSEIEALMYRLLGEVVDVSVYSDDGLTVTRGEFMEFILQYLD